MFRFPLFFHRFSNVTSTKEHVRVRRSIADVAKRIWKGFHFKLATPSYNWRKQIGGAMLGASMGIIIKNVFEVKICKLWYKYCLHSLWPRKLLSFFCAMQIVYAIFLQVALNFLQHLFLSITAPLSGFAKVDIHDAAWATLHIGLLGFDYDVFRAEICFKGDIHYEVNILAVSIVLTFTMYHNYLYHSPVEEIRPKHFPP